MPLRNAKGDMYPFVDYTWNAIKGKCPHDCKYCYMKRFPLNPVRLDQKEFKTALGKNRFIFVGSSCDMWADQIPNDWILPVLRHCRGFQNKYLFQSKNPRRFVDFIRNHEIDPYDKILIPEESIFATTIETNEYPAEFPHENIPGIDSRRHNMCLVRELGFKVTVTIEPIMRFDINELVPIITDIDPEWVSIGADSKKHDLPEPDADDVKLLIHMISQNYEVVVKENLKRIIG